MTHKPSTLEPMHSVTHKNQTQLDFFFLLCACVYPRVCMRVREREREREGTLLMLFEKLSAKETAEELVPILFIKWLVINNTKGVRSPSPTDPMNPKIINNKSTPSACMNMELIEPFLLFFFIVTTLLFSCSMFPNNLLLGNKKNNSSKDSQISNHFSLISSKIYKYGLLKLKPDPLHYLVMD